MKFIGNLSSGNGEEPFVACVVGSKRVGGEGEGGGEGEKRQSLLPSLYRDPPPLFPSSPSPTRFVCIKKKPFYKKCRIGLWLVRSFLPSISCQSIPQKGAHKNSRGLFIEQKYVIKFYNARWRKCRELTLHQQKYRDTHTSLEKKEPARSFHARNTSQKKDNEKLVIICPPSPNPQLPLPREYPEFQTSTSSRFYPL